MGDIQAEKGASDQVVCAVEKEVYLDGTDCQIHINKKEAKIPIQTFSKRNKRTQTNDN